VGENPLNLVFFFASNHEEVVNKENWIITFTQLSLMDILTAAPSSDDQK
jgi:hypothetical protein